MTALMVGLSGCASLEAARSYAGSKAQELTAGYCEQPLSHRLILRAEANRALDGKAAIVVSCEGDEGYDAFRAAYVAPYLDRDLEGAVMAELLRRGSYTLPDGRVVKLVIE